MLKDRTEIFVQPVTLFDRDAHIHFHAQLDDDAIRMRHFALVKELSSQELNQFTNSDYRREIAFIAICNSETLRVVRIFMH